MRPVACILRVAVFTAGVVAASPAAAAPPPACAPPTTAQGRYIELRVPGGTDTVPTAINDRGDIVGTYQDAQGRVHGFLYRNFRFHTIDVPGAVTTRAVDINNDGTVAGDFDGHGFVRHDGAFTMIDVPGAFETDVNAINDRGVTAGLALEPDDFDGRQVGFVRRANGTFERIASPAASSVLVADINNQQSLLVNADERQLLRIHGVYQVIEPCRPLDTVISITDRHHLVGVTVDPALGMQLGLLQTPTTYRTYRYPGAAQTLLRDMNEWGVAVGQAADPQAGAIGFVFIPQALVSRLLDR